ncbi:MAG: PAS domain S-box protein [Desulfobacterales bacterium]
MRKGDMRLRVILLVLSLLAVFSAAAGGYLYYSAVNAAALTEAERQARVRLEILTKSISSSLLENTRVVRSLAEMEVFSEALTDPSQPVIDKANSTLDHFKRTFEVDVCYLMDAKGTTIASSNRHDADSFVNKNFSFRPYFKKAIQGWPSAYLALGITSEKRGVYNSHPVYGPGSEDPVGILVIKSSVDVIENRLGLTSDDIVLVTDPRGVIFISNRGDWLFQLAWKVPQKEMKKIAADRQFGIGPWKWIGLELNEQNRDVMLAGERYLIDQVEFDEFPGWKVVLLRSHRAISRSISAPLIRITGPVVLALCLLIGGSVLFLYRKASQEISHRRSMEKALRESEERYRSLYNRTPAMLHSIDTDGRLVSVSDFWAEVLGCGRSEAIGKKLTDFMTETSRRYAEEEVFPAFFRNGSCKEVSYRFVKKDGREIDILLSAIADRDAAGKMTRTLAVSIDVTERKRAEEALEQAKEELSRYSRDLERQVHLRTREISDILKYTPAIVYFKDNQGRYLLANSRYEQLFGVKNEEVRGRTDEEVLPAEVAVQFRRHDSDVLSERRSQQVEERILHGDGIHTYLSVKFPVYDETGEPRGMCSIATDITVAKKAQDQLRRLSGSILANQEIERAAIARELHDELGQVLTALRMDAVWLQEHFKACDARAAERALTMSHLIDRTIADVRNLAFRLRPGILDDLGLVDALELFTTDFEKRTGITCAFEHGSIPACSETVSTAAYRIVQEALTNVARYAAAGHVDVRLELTNGSLKLVVTDDGRGFDTAALGENEGLGLVGMTERAILAGGRLEIVSTPGKGTRVSLDVPLEGAQVT